MTRWPSRLEMNRIRTPGRENHLRRPGKITARYPGHMVHMDVKKIRQAPRWRRLVGSWPRFRAGQEEALAADRLHLPPLDHRRVLPTGLHRSTRGRNCRNVIAFFHRARAFFTARDHADLRLINGSNYAGVRRAQPGRSSAGTSAPGSTRLGITGRSRRYQRIMTDECLYARAYTSENSGEDPIGMPFCQPPSPPHRLRRSAPSLTPPPASVTSQPTT